MSRDDKLQSLYELIAQTTDPEDIAALLEDLCTRKEAENMAERLFAAKLLMEGNTYNQVMAQANISSATLSRVSPCVQYGAGYAKLLKSSTDDAAT
jgi:TrpR-related protein YerC/YecD